jgi:copper transport protein
MLALMVYPANAHGYIVRSIPEDRATLERPPTRVQYWFSEALEPAFSEITLLNAEGNEVAVGGVDEEDNSLMVLRPPADLPDGAYVVSLRPAFASDGHVVAETRVFFVGTSVAGVTGSAASDAAVPLEIVWRGLLLTSTSLLLGVTSLYNLVLRPAWGSKRHTAGFLPPRVMTQLTIMTWIALIIALAGNTLALLQNTMVLFDQPLGAVLRTGTWNTTRVGSQFGGVWTARTLLLIVFGGLLTLATIWRRDKPRTIAPTWNALMWGAALITATFAVSSHAAGALVMPWVAVLMHWLHMTAVGVWTGGLAALVLILPVALRPYTREDARLALLAALRRFSRFAAVALALTVTTGIYNSLNWLYAPAELTQTTYGIALVYKVLLFVGLVGVAGIQHIAANPERYARLNALTDRIGSRPTLSLEMGFAAAVLIAAGAVSATPPPTPSFITNDTPPPRASQSIDDISVDMTISPGGLGVNTYDTRIRTAGDDTVEGATVFVQFVRPDEDRRGIWHVAEPIDDGLYVAAGDELDEVGRWLALVDVVGEDTSTRLAFEWDISDDASVIQSIPPRIQHWAALSAVMIALGWAVTPAYRTFMERMRFDALTGTVVIIAIAVTGVLTAVGFEYIARLQAQSAALMNPPPENVNPVLPDATSLQIGAASFSDLCTWDTTDRAFAALVERLPRTRDEELLEAVTEGFRGLPPCSATGEVNWHIVNYLRTLEAR